MAAEIITPSIPTTDADPLLTVDDACVELKIGTTKCWELIASRALDVVRLGKRCTRIKAASVARLKEFGLSASAHVASTSETRQTGGHHEVR